MTVVRKAIVRSVSVDKKVKIKKYMRIIAIVGARPQFIKSAMLNIAVRERQLAGADIQLDLLHTGQHYDHQMSEVFFRNMNIPEPKWRLSRSGTAEEMSNGILAILEKERPDYVLVFGNANTTLAGALAAEKAGIPLIYIEAGLRSYNNDSIEEYNRIETDRRASILFCPTHQAMENLKKEGSKGKIFFCGDILLDVAMTYGRLAIISSQLLDNLQLAGKKYYLATLHRAETIDNPAELESVLMALMQLETPVVMTLHPRTRKALDANPGLMKMIRRNTSIMLIPSQNYTDMAMLEKCASLIITDSGGVQKEAYFYHKPCIIVRNETEYMETVNAGWAVLSGTDTHRILEAINNPPHGNNDIEDLGDGHASEIIVDTLLSL